MKKLLTVFVLGVSILLGGCLEESNKHRESTKAKQAAESISYTENAEIESIKRRLELTSKVNLSGYIVLFNSTGQPILYTGVVGKVTSGGKRLTRTDECFSSGCRPAASDEGTYGSSNPYIYFWDAAGKFHQTNLEYLYSTQPIRLKIEPLVVNVTEK